MDSIYLTPELEQLADQVTRFERLWPEARILAIGGGATEVMLDEAAKRH